MSFFYNYILKFISDYADSKVIYSISYYLFCFCITMGGLVFFIITLFKGARTKSVKWLLGLYELCFLIDLGLCFVESKFCNNVFKDLTTAYLYCFVKLMLNYSLYLVVRFQKFLLKPDKNEKTDNNQLTPKCYICENANTLSSQRNTFFCTDIKKNTYAENNNCNAIKILNDCIQTNKNSELDVNIAYIRGLIDRLKQKNLSYDEIEKLDDINLALRQTVENDSLTVQKLNEYFIFLVNQMQKYDVLL